MAIWLPLYTNDFLASSKIALMTTEEIGAYVLLLCHAWQDPQCSLPDDDDSLQKLGRFSGDISRVRACFVSKKKRLVNERLLKEWEKVQHNKALASQHAHKRWEKSGNAGAMRAHIDPQCSSPSPSQSLSSSSSSSLSESLSSSLNSPSSLNSLPPINFLIKSEELVELWNGRGLPECKKLTAPLRKKLDAMIKQHQEKDWWTELFDRVQRSDFLCGRVRDFTATLDWVVGPKNLAKIEQGNYDSVRKSDGMTRMVETFLQGDGT